MKYKQVIFIFTFLFSICLFNTSFKNTNEWELYKQSKGIQFFYKQTDCDDVANGLYQKYVIFKIVNTTDFKVNIEWNKQLWYNNYCTTCNKTNENDKVIINIDAHSELIGDCKSEELSIFSEFKNHPEVNKLTDFEIIDLKIKPILR